MTRIQVPDPYAHLLPGGVRPWFWSVLLTLTAVRAVSAASLDLHPDEAYYWLWSTRLAGGYYDHPYGVALMIRLTTLFSSAEFWVRAGGLATMLTLTWLTWDMVRRATGSPEAGRAAALLLNVGAAFSAGAIVMTPDTPMVLCWGLGIYALHRLLEGGSPWWWTLAGIAGGAGLASKYTMVFFGGLVLLAIACSARLRATLRHPAWLVGLAGGAAVFAPVVAWNARHGFASFLFQLRHGTGGGGSWNPVGFVELLAGQALILTPLAAAALVWGQVTLVRRWLREGRPARLLLWWAACVPWVATIVLLSLRAKIEQNWPLFAWYAAVAGYLVALDPGREGHRAFFRWVTGTSLAVTILVHLHLVIPVVAVPGIDPTDEFHGWKEVGAELRSLSSGGEVPDLVIASRHQLAAELAYYGGRGIPVTDWPGQGRINQFDFWAPDEAALVGKVVFYVEESPATLRPGADRIGRQMILKSVVASWRGSRKTREIGFFVVRRFRTFSPLEGGTG